MSGLSEYVGSNEYSEYTDEQVILMIHKGDKDAQDYIIDKYKNMVKIKAYEYFMIGADRDDIIQEGMIGLYKAIRDFKPEKSAPFYYFAQLCVTRQILSAVKAATRQKHQPLNAYISLNKNIYDDSSETSFIDMVSENQVSNPEELLIGREGKNSIESHMLEVLSELELKVLILHLKGKKYEEIARAMSKDEKAIDNALQRIRRKIEKFLLYDRNLR